MWGVVYANLFIIVLHFRLANALEYGLVVYRFFQVSSIVPLPFEYIILSAQFICF